MYRRRAGSSGGDDAFSRRRPSLDAFRRIGDAAKRAWPSRTFAMGTFFKTTLLYTLWLFLYGFVQKLWSLVIIKKWNMTQYDNKSKVLVWNVSKTRIYLKALWFWIRFALIKGFLTIVWWLSSVLTLWWYCNIFLCFRL